jgi:DNA-binding CsgD family transcriptional regulator
VVYEVVGRSLLEREAELAMIDALLDEACHERGRVLVLEGPPGIGKTRLVQEVQSRALAGGFEVATARSSELERDFPFGVVRQLFEPLLANGGSRKSSSLLSGAARFAEAALSDETLQGIAAVEDEPSYATVHGVYWLAANVAGRRPLLIAVDDAHWADAASLRWLAYLTKRIEGLRALVVVAVTASEPQAEPRLLDDIVADPLAAVVRFSSLSECAVGELVREWLAPDADQEFCAACFAATQGNAFLLRELVAQLAAEGVEPKAEQAMDVPALGATSVAHTVLRRISRMGRDASWLARATAVLGDGVERQAAAALAGLERRSAAAAAGALVKVEIFRNADQLGFVHPIVREAVYSDVDFVDRAAWHARAAEMLREQGSSLDSVAVHLLAAGPAVGPWAVEALQEAAHRARARGALDEAATYLSRALAESLPPEARRDLLRALGSVELHALRASGFDHMSQAIELTDDRVERARTALELGRALATAGRASQAVVVLDRGIADAAGADRELETRLEAELIGAAAADLASAQLAHDKLRRLREQVEAGAPASPGALSIVAFHLISQGESAAEGTRLAERALAEERLFCSENSRFWGFAVSALAWGDELELAARVLDQAVKEAQSRGSMLLFAFTSSLRSEVAYRRGAVTEAEADARASLDAVEQDGGQPGGDGLSAPAHGGLSSPLALLISALIERGQLEAASAALERSCLEESLPELWRYNLLLDSRGRLRIAEGRVEEGLADLLECGRRLDRWGARNPAVIPWRSSAALALSTLDARDEAERLVAEEVELSRELGAARALGIALRGAGLVEGGNRGVELLTEAVAVLEGSPARLEHARALTDLAAAVRRKGQRSEARPLLRRALSLAGGLGATALAERAHDELVATGARPRRAVATGPSALTASEHRVARLAEEGLTNRAIAQTLFVTEKTIELHLRNAYQKLDIRSRTQLAKALGRGGSPRVDP